MFLIFREIFICLYRTHVKFTDSGSVTLKIKLDKAQSKLRIEVTDTGCGIPPEEREEIFLCLSV